MKRFHELTKPQQDQAVQYALDKLHELVVHGVVVTDAQMTKAQAKEVAEAAAEDAWYSEPTDMIVADIVDGE
jgi:L-aminopeptidase/D-esterase-like protein